MHVAGTQITPSSTTDSLGEAPIKGYTPSMTSSGYGSQAVSTLTLSSDDSISIKSMEEISESTAKSGQASASLKRASTGASTDSDADDANSSGDKTSGSIEEEEEAEDEADAEGIAAAREKAAGEEGNATASSADDGIFTELSNMTSGTDGGSEQDPDVAGRTRSDSLLDEQIPDINDSPLKPIPSPSISNSMGEFFSEDSSTVTDTLHAVDADSDPYSVTAMEELEKLGEEDREISMVMEGSVSSIKSPCQPANSQLESEQLHKCSKKPAFEASTPKEILAEKKGSGSKGGSGKKRGSGMRPRPMSMVVSPQAEVMTRAWQDDINRRSSLHLSEDSLAGTDSENCIFVFLQVISGWSYHNNNDTRLLHLPYGPRF